MNKKIGSPRLFSRFAKFFIVLLNRICLSFKRNTLLEEVRRDDTARVNSARPQAPAASNRYDSASAMSSLNQPRYRNNGSGGGGNYRNYGARHFADRSSQFLGGHQNSALAFRFMNARDFTPDDYEVDFF